MEYYMDIKKEEILPFEIAWMDLKKIVFSEISIERQVPYDSTHMWNLINKIN